MTDPTHDIGTARAILVMGVSGAGKSTLGRALAERLGYSFIEGDDLHATANVAKMARGEPLDDADRWPWLQRVADALGDAAAARGGVAACSALKRRYRDFIGARIGVPVMIVHPEMDPAGLRARLASRSGHFMPASLLDSQFEALDRPDASTERACIIDATLTVNEQVAVALAALHQAAGGC